ncbi:MAG: hypothetical protein ABIQ32_04405 [Sphingomicrobium sp.]
MFQLALAAFAFLGADTSVAQQNAQEIARARAAVAEMSRLAVTSDEKALAEHDGQIVERAANLLSKRDTQSRPTKGSPTPSSSQAGMGETTTQVSNPIGAAAGGGGQDQLLGATKAMQETQMSFNLQYLQLQSQMQHENRSYTAVSNIMKTKHDTVKNSISNIR